jgi:hypothetical protein
MRSDIKVLLNKCLSPARDVDFLEMVTGIVELLNCKRTVLVSAHEHPACSSTGTASSNKH